MKNSLAYFHEKLIDISINQNDEREREMLGLERRVVRERQVSLTYFVSNCCDSNLKITSFSAFRNSTCIFRKTL